MTMTDNESDTAPRKIAFPSIASLFIGMYFQGHSLSSGTGFVVSTQKGPHLITNRHNVTGRDQDTGAPLSNTAGIPDEIRILHNKKDYVARRWVVRAEPLFDGQTPRWTEHPTLGPAADLIALPLTNLDGVELLPYDLKSESPIHEIHPADAVSVIGFPFAMGSDGALAIWATGFLASDPDTNCFGKPIQLIDCRSRPGQSGSPVIAYRGGGVTRPMDDADGYWMFKGPVIKFIGIYSGRINPESDIGIVWKALAIQELINSL